MGQLGGGWVSPCTCLPQVHPLQLFGKVFKYLCRHPVAERGVGKRGRGRGRGQEEGKGRVRGRERGKKREGYWELCQ